MTAHPNQPGPGNTQADPLRFAWLLSVLRIDHGREILRLAMPTVMTMLSQTLMWTVDTALLGRVSSLALAAAGLGGIITWTSYSLFNHLSRISQTFVAQAHGRGDDRAVAHYTWQGIYISLVAGLIIQILGYYSYLVLPFTKNSPDIQSLTYVYIKWRTLSAVATQLTFSLMGFFQGRRDVKTPMWAGIIANAANIVLDIWLIYGWHGIGLGEHRFLAVPPLGVMGAALATSVGQVINAGILGVCLFKPSHRRKYQTHQPPRPIGRQIRNMVRIGLPAAWENFIDMTSFTLFSVFIGRAGAVALASNQITIQLLAFSFMPMWGISIAGSVLTGNWIGAGRPDKAAAYGRQVYKVGIYYTVAVAVALILARRWIFAVFSNDPAILAIGAGLAVAAALFQICDGLRMVAVGILQGAGDTRYPMFLSLAILWGLFVPLAYQIVVVSGGGVREAWFWGAFCFLLQAVFLYARFRSGKWQKIRIFSDAP